MDGIVDQIVEMGHGPVSVVVNCFQYASTQVPARVGSRVVEASPESVAGLTQQPVHFSACTTCGAVSVGLGIAGDDNVTRLSLQPDDPRARLLLSIITETDHHRQWAKVMDEPARVVGLINVHGAAKMSETGSTCFNCV